ncbi:MAG: SpoIIE family protein phosphatase [Pseudomonadales bacterium]
MSLIVAGPEQEGSASLPDQLERLGNPTIRSGELSVVLDLCEQTPPELVICTDLEWARQLVMEHPRVPVVLATHATLDRDLLLGALHAGLADAWQLPADASELAQRLDAIRSRLRAAANEAERQLTQFVADLERDQRAGRYIQMGMLPPNPMVIDRYRFHHRIVPSLILSGDFVDYFQVTRRHFAFYVADVSGHGASSAFVTVLLKNFSRRLRREYRPSMLREPGEILQWINRELLDQRIDKHVAMLLGVGDLESDEIRLVNGGHYPPAIRVSSGAATFVEQKGRPVGLFDDVSYAAATVALAPGDGLVMFSDGVLDAMGTGDLTAKETRLLAAAESGGELNGIWDMLQMDVDGVSKPDDMTCLIVRREA